MYSVDARDRVVELPGVPQSDIGAPLPFVWASESRLTLHYLAAQPDPNGDGTYVTVLSPTSPDETVAVVRFVHPCAHMFGPPNDEAFSGHPLASRGLSPYAAFEVHDSSWVRRLEAMNSVHPRHDPSWFMQNKRHFIFAFHDSTFECIAKDFTTTLEQGSLIAAVQRSVIWAKGAF